VVKEALITDKEKPAQSLSVKHLTMNTIQAGLCTECAFNTWSVHLNARSKYLTVAEHFRNVSGISGMPERTMYKKK